MKQQKSWSSLSNRKKANAMIGAVEPLLEMFAICDDVFSEDDALSAEKRQMSLARIYRTWKDVRGQLDPEFDSKARPRNKIGMRRGDRIRIQQHARVIEDDLG